MTFADYVNGIRFRFLDPGTRPALFERASARLARYGVSLEIANTRLPVGRTEMKRRLAPLCAMDRMSTFAIGAMINYGVSRMPAGAAFVNVGVWNGFTLLAGMADNVRASCIGIDNFSEFGGPRAAFLAAFGKARSPVHEFHEMDYRDYFARVHRAPIGFYVYDGEHSYESQLRGLETAEPFFTDRCVLLVDDTNWDAPRRATLDFVNARPGRYRIVLDRRTACNAHPTLWNGVMILQRNA